MTRTISEELKQQWKENILNQRSSGLSIAAWCRRSEIMVHHFYYWQKKLFPKDPIDRSAFTEISTEKNQNFSNSGVSLEYKGINIHLGNKFEFSVLKRCLEVLKEC